MPLKAATSWPQSPPGSWGLPLSYCLGSLMLFVNAVMLCNEQHVPGMAVGLVGTGYVKFFVLWSRAGMLQGWISARSHKLSPSPSLPWRQRGAPVLKLKPNSAFSEFKRLCFKTKPC